MDLYAENILDHYKHPRKKESLVTASISHEEKNLSCGDALKIDLMIENDAIKQFGWTGDGCAISQAAISILSEELEGKSVSKIEAMTPKN
ncbi:MAG: iron-sulfur cluster assembly scaffold protein, partial [Candidatus Peribacteraceae bacterium]|nr:iron-sulfur cluster assembly scaffold protein [Candidatus Peribacteraceae bacterium]